MTNHDKSVEYLISGGRREQNVDYLKSGAGEAALKSNYSRDD